MSGQHFVRCFSTACRNDTNYMSLERYWNSGTFTPLRFFQILYGLIFFQKYTNLQHHRWQWPCRILIFIMHFHGLVYSLKQIVNFTTCTSIYSCALMWTIRGGHLHFPEPYYALPVHIFIIFLYSTILCIFRNWIYVLYSLIVCTASSCACPSLLLYSYFPTKAQQSFQQPYTSHTAFWKWSCVLIIFLICIKCYEICMHFFNCI